MVCTSTSITYMCLVYAYGEQFLIALAETKGVVKLANKQVRNY